MSVAEKAWALELMRDVGFTVEPALGRRTELPPSGMDRR